MRSFSQSLNKVRHANGITLIAIIPILGILSFISLYFYSTLVYPGGSQESAVSEGFSWIHNYWCNLLNEKAINGKMNPARPAAILAMIILCLSLMVFFILFALRFSEKMFWKWSIILNSILSMGLSVFIFTEHHDLITSLASLFGFFAMIGIVKEIYNSQMHFYKILGLLCILLLGLNNYIYYTEHLIEILPLLQKLTFLFVLTWIIGLSLKLLQKSGS